MLVATVLLARILVVVTVVAGGGVIVERLAVYVCSCFLSGSSQQPKNKPGVSQTSESVVVLVEVGAFEVLRLGGVVVVWSQPPPNQPGLHDLEAVVVAGVDGDADIVGRSVVVVTVTLASSLQPNQPGVRQVVVV